MNFMKITKITSVNHISVFDDLIIKIHCYCHLNHYGEFLTIDKAWIGKFSVVNTETRFRGGGVSDTSTPSSQVSVRTTRD